MLNIFPRYEKIFPTKNIYSFSENIWAHLLLQQLCCVEGCAPLETGLEAGGRVGGVVGAGGAGAPGVGGAVRGGGGLRVQAVAEGGQLLEVVPAAATFKHGRCFDDVMWNVRSGFCSLLISHFPELGGYLSTKTRGEMAILATAVANHHLYN